MSAVYVVIGNGASSVEAIRGADSTPANWLLARERGVCEVGHEPSGAEWCVVLDVDAVDATTLDGDRAVITYERVPSDSPALARWRSV